MSSDTVIYEQPLNERMRSLLRIEYLLDRIHARIDVPDQWSNRSTLESILETQALLSRSDLKTEFIKELERHASTLAALYQNPGVDPARLNTVHSQVQGLLQSLRSRENGLAQPLKNSELLNTVCQRISIPAGTCDFDLPTYHFWLQTPAAQRLADLHEWASSFDEIDQVVKLCLKLTRESAEASHESALEGFFQRNLDHTSPCQLIRVQLPAGVPWFPEISAGRHRLSIRMLSQDSANERPTQISENVDFGLHCCKL